MPTVAIVYHSGYGHTAAQAQAIYRGVQGVEAVTVHLIQVSDVEASWEKLDAATTIVFGSPTYMGSVSAPFKTFMDATSRRWLQGTWNQKLAAGFTNSGGLSGDKLNTLNQICVFAAQHGMLWISLGVASTGRGDDDLNRLGSSLGAMSQSDHQSTEPAPGDLRTAELFGERIAKITLGFHPG
jgi:NAD(P)H dehydrogenase (quinone)